MLPQFGLVHMDGRIYDPALGRFLSPDNYVQLPENSQSFNRYSYCINNPLKYTDPSGQLFGIDDAVLIFGAFNLFASIINAKATGQNIWKAAGVSILSSAASYGIGGLFSGPLQGISGTFGGELLRAGAHGLASGVCSALQGDNFGRSFLAGAASSGIGSFASGVNMNDGLMLASCATMGGLTEWALGGDFLQGAMTGLTIGALNHTPHKRNNKRRTLHNRQIQHGNVTLDENVGDQGVELITDSYVIYEYDSKTRQLSLEIDVVSQNGSCDAGDIRGAFQATVYGGNGYETTVYLTEPTGSYYTYPNANFTGTATINNVNYHNVSKIKVNVFGGWNFRNGYGGGAISFPTIFGHFLPGIHYNHNFFIPIK